MDINDYYKDSSIGTNFIDRLSALLQIKDVSRVKIVGVRTGSLIIVSQITPPADGSANMATENTNLRKAISSGQFVQTMSSIGKVTTVSSTYSVVTPTNDSSDSSNSASGGIMSMGVIVGIVGGVIVLITIVVGFVLVVRKKQLTANIATSTGDEIAMSKNGTATNLNRDSNI